MGIYIHPRKSNGNVWEDANLRGDWFEEEAKENSDTARYHLGFVVSYLGCPVMWRFQLQTEIFLSSIDSEYIALSQALRNIINIIYILKEMKAPGYNVGTVSPTVLCNLFEDNSRALKLARAPGMRPRIKNINVNILPTIQHTFLQLSHLSDQRI